ncbi:MAG: hypothetical protein KDD40_00475 [Bdellovibrionales bacterium]|nr:hypothetical protein [Bdellovibrionales bacterium]
MKDLKVYIIIFQFMLMTACGDQVKFDDIVRSSNKTNAENIDPSTLPPEEPGGVSNPPPGNNPPSTENPAPPIPPSPAEPKLIAITETLNQIPLQKAVDILIVEDTTLSMHTDRWSLHQKFSKSVDNLAGLDWRLAITSTDLGKNRLDGKIITLDNKGTQFITAQSSNPLKLLKDNISFDHCNSNDYILGWGDVGCTLGNEKLLGATIQAVAKNKEFFRDKTNLAVIYITDEDEEALANEHKATPQEVINAVKLNLGERDFKAYGAIIEPGDTQCLIQQKSAFEEPAAVYGETVASLIQQTGGQSVSICSHDYSDLFKSIEGNVTSALKTHFQLAHAPEIDIEVSLEPVQNIKYSLVKDQLIFASPPAEGSKITISYKFLE